MWIYGSEVGYSLLILLSCLGLIVRLKCIQIILFNMTTFLFKILTFAFWFRHLFIYPPIVPLTINKIFLLLTHFVFFIGIYHERTFRYKCASVSNSRNSLGVSQCTLHARWDREHLAPGVSLSPAKKLSDSWSRPRPRQSSELPIISACVATRAVSPCPQRRGRQ